MKSSWDETKAKSLYHFDTEIMDPKWDAAILLGTIEPTWQNDLEDIIKNATPARWDNRKGDGIQINPEQLAAEEYDMDRIGMDPKMTVTHLNWTVPDSLKYVTNWFGLDDCMNRVHVQFPGEMWNLHIDKLQDWCPEDPSRVMRIQVQLTDWQPGQFWEYGNYHHRGWKAGEVTTFDWANVPHCTANAGHHPRATLQITGVVTDKTRDFLRILRSRSPYSV